MRAALILSFYHGCLSSAAVCNNFHFRTINLKGRQTVDYLNREPEFTCLYVCRSICST
jgi:hypothetical protein